MARPSPLLHRLAARHLGPRRDAGSAAPRSDLELRRRIVATIEADVDARVAERAAARREPPAAPGA